MSKQNWTQVERYGFIRELETYFNDVYFALSARENTSTGIKHISEMIVYAALGRREFARWYWQFKIYPHPMYVIEFKKHCPRLMEWLDVQP